jgi:hypothetical protein
MHTGAQQAAFHSRAWRRPGLNQAAAPQLDTQQFERAPGAAQQGGLFDGS